MNENAQLKSKTFQQMIYSVDDLSISAMYSYFCYFDGSISLPLALSSSFWRSNNKKWKLWIASARCWCDDGDDDDAGFFRCCFSSFIFGVHRVCAHRLLAKLFVQLKLCIRDTNETHTHSLTCSQKCMPRTRSDLPIHIHPQWHESSKRIRTTNSFKSE